MMRNQPVVADKGLLKTKQVLTLNNADEVLKSFQSASEDDQELFLTMVQGNAYREVVITDTNIKNNSKFLLDMWD